MFKRPPRARRGSKKSRAKKKELMAHEHHRTTEVLDPVCGMTISPEDAVGHVKHEGHTYYFCNESCLEKFKADPKRYVEPDTASRWAQAAGATDVEYTCPMDPEVRQTGPGSCPKCGMALEPVLPEATPTEYTCPMHPEIVRDEPGSCPICGMALEPRSIVLEEENPE